MLNRTDSRSVVRFAWTASILPLGCQFGSPYQTSSSVSRSIFVAADAPGFTIDSPVEELGRRIILPPQLEDRRERIEARLTPLPDPRAGWAGAAAETV